MVENCNFSFFSKDISFTLKNQFKIKEWVLLSILKEGKTAGEISYIFCSDEYIYQINLEHLKHNTYTDIITFNYCENNIISGDIFISIDRVKENAITYNTTFQNELHRVIIHGILHLIGFNDKTNEDKALMRSKEDFYLSLLSI
ncbi:MAG: rRNA maturation RNase YbeY [Bacteroidetes bacterium RIFCSPLOWO2_12_FULL_31_6]|nr:MAG: rRNA maturation RNase YbeY [Bacteroidetes bacterium RIFCSPLOWO2_12_FULL_31_6]